MESTAEMCEDNVTGELLVKEMDAERSRSPDFLLTP